MNAAEWWDNVRSCAKELQTARAELYVLEKYGKASSGGSGCKGGVGDPTCSQALEIHHARLKLEAAAGYCSAVLNDAHTALDRLSHMTEPRTACVMRLYYIDGIESRQIAERLCLTRRRVNQIKADALQLCDDVGMVHMIRGWSYES
ncbi:sigma factor-like helix-turn-helix DNA-binding protein [Atopobium fossor]|uniref:sigma factor-like helix-turn-helix DNA-binding protein n=1 Tax=Atopobium fossor TaxID=39487 RepID=UPI00041D44F0|nr:sigma factor-like helix-turn-helix DNA-binding protein [Atopobium fossor]